MASGCFVRRFFVSRFPLVWFRLDGRRRLHTSLLPRCGVAYDSYELSDIVDPRVGDYSVYVLPNAFSLSRQLQNHANSVGRDDPIAPPAGSCGLPVRRFYVGNTKALANAGIDYASLQVEYAWLRTSRSVVSGGL